MIASGRGQVTLAKLAVLAALTSVAVGCTGPHGQAGSKVPSPGRVSSGPPAARSCGRAEVRTAVSDFFTAWNHREAPALGRLFAAAGELDLTTSRQHAENGTDSWTSAGGGTGARGQIDAFAARQWRLGEKLSYRGIQVVLNGGDFGDGGYAGYVVARFSDGTVQPMGYAKFIYSCASRGFVHVVIVSPKAAAPARSR